MQVLPRRKGQAPYLPLCARLRYDLTHEGRPLVLDQLLGVLRAAGGAAVERRIPPHDRPAATRRADLDLDAMVGPGVWIPANLRAKLVHTVSLRLPARLPADAYHVRQGSPHDGHHRGRHWRPAGHALFDPRGRRQQVVGLRGVPLRVRFLLRLGLFPISGGRSGRVAPLSWRPSIRAEPDPPLRCTAHGGARRLCSSCTCCSSSMSR